MHLEPAEIRPLTEADLGLVLGWRNHPSIRAVMFTSREIGIDEHRAWFERVSQESSRRHLIVETDEGPLGFVQFSAVEDDGVADWGFYARPTAPAGSGSAMGLAALDYAFYDLQLHKVCGRALGSNEASRRLHRRLGFKEEGILRDQHKSEGGFQSVFCFGLLRTEWLQARSELMSRKDSHIQGTQR